MIFDNQDFRVIDATWKAGTTDKPHTHPVPSVIYNITGCTLKLHNADGETVEVTAKSGTVGPVPLVIEPHTAENPGATDCRSIIVNGNKVLVRFRSSAAVQVCAVAMGSVRAKTTSRGHRSA
jgi:hypothetical protein